VRHSDGRVVVAVDNTAENDPGGNCVRRLLSTEAAGLRGYNDAVPLGWLKFLDVAAEIVDKGVPQLQLDEARRLALGCHIGVEDDGDRELLLMLHLHTSFGLLMHFDQDALRDLIILKPQWLLDRMAALLCRRQIAEKQRAARETLPEWRRLSAEGRLDTKLLPEVWPELQPRLQREMLAYMEKFGFCSQLPSEDGIYVIPPLLPPCTDASWVEASTDTEVGIRFIHEDGEWDESRGFLPQCLFFNLEVQLLQHAGDLKQALKYLNASKVSGPKFLTD
jgi:hypothetical protein